MSFSNKRTIGASLSAAALIGGAFAGFATASSANASVDRAHYVKSHVNKPYTTQSCRVHQKLVLVYNNKTQHEGLLAANSHGKAHASHHRNSMSYKHQADHQRSIIARDHCHS